MSQNYQCDTAAVEYMDYRQMIFTAYAGESGFNDAFHLDNFIKYLFTQSKKRPPNNQTKFNSYFTVNKPNRIFFVTDPKMALHISKNEIKNSMSLHTKMKNDLTYFLFAFRFDDVLVSNFLQENKTDDGREISIYAGAEMILHIVNQYFNGDEALFNEAIQNIMDGVENYIFYNDDNLEPYLRLHIEETLHDSLPDVSGEMLVSMSHVDQGVPEYHIHRLFAIH